MGFIDNIFKSLDDTLKAVEDGAIEKKITSAIDSFEKSVEKAPDALKKASEMPKKIIENMDDKSANLQKTAAALKVQAGKTVDIIKRKD